MREPELHVYHSILDYAVNQTQIAFLIVRLDTPLSPQGSDIIQRLKPFMQRIVSSNEWPGTQMLSGSAFVHFFSYNRETAAILRESSTNLYQWVQPCFPEDLCLLKSYEEPWMVSISHERDAYFVLNESEFNNLVANIPELSDILTKDDVSLKNGGQFM